MKLIKKIDSEPKTGDIVHAIDPEAKRMYKDIDFVVSSISPSEVVLAVKNEILKKKLFKMEREFFNQHFK